MSTPLENNGGAQDPVAPANPPAIPNSSEPVHKGERTDGRTVQSEAAAAEATIPANVAPDPVAGLLARAGFSEPPAGEPPGAGPSGASFRGERTDGRGEGPSARREPRVMLEFFTPTQLKDYLVPEGTKLVGDFHIVRGGVFVIGGAPGVGKSRAAFALAVAGATGKDWFGLKVHRRFRTMILQAENGRVRLKMEVSDLDCAGLDEWILVSAVPAYGFALSDRDFIDQLKAAILKFKPDLIIIDPWTECVKDQMEKDYRMAFDAIRDCLPVGDDRPALGIVAHTRKPRMGEKASGRALLNLLSGSLIIGSVPRAVFIIQAASDDVEDKRVVITNCKNNDGELAPRSAWERRNGLFALVESFDWEAFDGGGKKERKGVTEEHIRELFDDGQARMTLKAAAERLQDVAGVGRTVVYNALKLEGGEFSRLLNKSADGTIGLRAMDGERSELGCRSN